MFFYNYKDKIPGIYMTDKLYPLWSTSPIRGRKNINVIIVDDKIIDGVIV
jgi:hypothetical protein